MRFLVLVVNKTCHPEESLSSKRVARNKSCHQNSPPRTKLVTKIWHPEQTWSQKSLQYQSFSSLQLQCTPCECPVHGRCTAHAHPMHLPFMSHACPVHVPLMSRACHMAFISFLSEHCICQNPFVTLYLSHSICHILIVTFH